MLTKLPLPEISRRVSAVAPRRSARNIVLAMAALLCCGCQFSPQATRWSREFLLGKEEPEIPDRMMVIWSDTVLHQPQQPGVRGFGGRIYFFRGNEHAPIEVDGGLAVYAFDATATDLGSTKPERKFVFTADQFNEYMSFTDMGPSYSVWIPWDQVGGPARQLSLVTRFEGRQGGVVISDPAIKLLPGLEGPSQGPKTPTAVHAGGSTSSPASSADAVISRASGVAAGGAENRAAAIVQAGHLDDRPAPADSRQVPPGDFGSTVTEVFDSRRRDATTIDLPPSFGRHLRTSSDPSSPQTPHTDANRPDDAPAAGAVPPPQGSQAPAISNTRAASAAASYPAPGRRYPFRRYPRTTAPVDPPRNGPASRELRTTPMKAGWIEPPTEVRNNR